MSIKSVIFDLDGTIVNSGKGIALSAQYALDKMGVPHGELQEFYRFIGPPLIDSFCRYYGMSVKEAELAIAYYRERYSVKGVYENTPYEGIEELLAALKKSGYKLYIGSSKPLEFVKEILHQHGFYHYFDFLATATMDRSRDKKEQVLRYLIDQTGISPAETVMVGDRCHDIEGAHFFGIKTIAVLFGFGSRAEFEEYKADFIAESPADILNFITKSL